MDKSRRAGAPCGMPPDAVLPEKPQRCASCWSRTIKTVRGFVAKGLREAGHVVDQADNGRDGLFMAASESFDAIILDRMLPGGIDGLRVLETLRGQDNRTPGAVPVGAWRRWTTGCAG